ncbi:uncharacterized protein ARMOST_20864 [Armillaria ostoyae]|uniref:Uncharacterized protein n=1 Tax=Armillaria ostoyae TaxID=47428 RepID=A0A284S8H7_ARMOS|nr:uncharacterized protein ARMOST_20864 [Armillaria ostoyae]
MTVISKLLFSQAKAYLYLVRHIAKYSSILRDRIHSAETLNARDKHVKGYDDGVAPQVLQLASENDSDIGMMERGVGTSLSNTPGVSAQEKL